MDFLIVHSYCHDEPFLKCIGRRRINKVKQQGRHMDVLVNRPIKATKSRPCQVKTSLLSRESAYEAGPQLFCEGLSNAVVKLEAKRQNTALKVHHKSKRID